MEAERISTGKEEDDDDEDDEVIFLPSFLALVIRLNLFSSTET